MCDGVYQLVFLSPEALLSNESWRDTVPSPVYQENLVAVVIDEFYQHSCHVTLGSNVTNYIPLWNENLAHVTRRIFPSPAPFPPRMRTTRKNMDGLRDYCQPTRDRKSSLSWRISSSPLTSPNTKLTWPPLRCVSLQPVPSISPPPLPPSLPQSLPSPPLPSLLSMPSTCVSILFPLLQDMLISDKPIDLSDPSVRHFVLMVSQYSIYYYVIYTCTHSVRVHITVYM